MDDYSFRPGGSLKLKGDKKKKRSRTEQERASATKEAQRAAREAENAERARAARSTSHEEGDKSGSGAEGGAEGASGGVKKTKTAAEEKFDKIQEERRRERAKKKAMMSHKDRVAEFNASLDRLRLAQADFHLQSFTLFSGYLPVVFGVPFLAFSVAIAL
ncbi:hypothetical protein QFC21_001273 [Naganishia friedmannii]|uniref:Uncharacterized protein n=1 Tax=Naganishia friedmannii TaxID=89922 RepID=A0ACC2W404_9TREE|nr:hypothetical protein QFC21_001273 [Naganishia friedmannii]